MNVALPVRSRKGRSALAQLPKDEAVQVRLEGTCILAEDLRGAVGHGRSFALHDGALPPAHRWPRALGASLGIRMERGGRPDTT